MRILIIGGSDAGISAALRIVELGAPAEVTVVLADEFPNWSVCGLPYYLSGETPDWHSLAHRTEFKGIEILRRHPAIGIYPAEQEVAVRMQEGAEQRLSYDRLIIATGAEPLQLKVPGSHLSGVHVLHTMGDALLVNRLIEGNPRPRSAIIVGAGYIGLEMAEALVGRGLDVTVLNRSARVFPSVDAEMSALIQAELATGGVRIVANAELQAITQNGGGGGLLAQASDGSTLAADLILIAVGVTPNSGLAGDAGITLGERGAIHVDQAMRTNLPNIFAAGDCAETFHRILDRNVYIPLGTTSHKQGRIAGEAAMGGSRLFAGSVGTQVVRLFTLVVGRTGLLEREARNAGFNPVTADIETWDHKAYYPGAERVRIRLVGDRTSGRLLGAQMAGPWHQAEISKRLDIFATALFHGMRVEELNDLDLSYAPPLSSPWDPVQIAAQAWTAIA